jgi:hypothetical protein
MASAAALETIAAGTVIHTKLNLPRKATECVLGMVLEVTGATITFAFVTQPDSDIDLNEDNSLIIKTDAGKVCVGIASGNR